ncbi:MAG: hypothetical protein PHU21_08090 [Elusimicrobia bacterium]|nr:hypothetical protein [Elusimicrobiota bacterium]
MDDPAKACWPLGMSLALLWLWKKAVELAAGLLVGLGLWAYLAWVKVPAAFALRCAAADWRTFFFLALALGLAAGWGPLRRRLAGQRLGVMSLSWLLPAATLLGLFPVYRLFAHDGPHRPNRYGFYTGFNPDSELVFEAGILPRHRIRTNSLGFRGREWSAPAAPGVRRALLVGDSFVWGRGIADESGLLDRRLERELSARGGGKWEVINVAGSPSALWYYVHALLAVGREVRPDLYVMSFNGFYDLEPWEVQRVKTGLPHRAVQMMEASGVSERLHRMGAALGDRYARGRRADPAAVADLRGEFRRLVAFIDETGGRLVVWEPLTPNPGGFFDEFLRHPRVAFASWSDAPGLPADLRPRMGHDAPWQEDQTLAFPGDGHPTPAGNAVFAKAIAAKAFSRPKD